MEINSSYNSRLAPPTCDYSVVVPVLNEEQTIPEMCARLSRVIAQVGGSWEVIYVNDGSTDQSFQTLVRLRPQYPFLRAINLSRNFGHQAALKAGLDHARGRAVILMDGDLQDSPEALPVRVLSGAKALRLSTSSAPNARRGWLDAARSRFFITSSVAFHGLRPRSMPVSSLSSITKS